MSPHMSPCLFQTPFKPSVYKALRAQYNFVPFDREKRQFCPLKPANPRG